MSQYFQSNQYQGGGGNYDPNLDLILYRTNDVCVSGKNGQNQFFMQIRSYNGSLPKVEFYRHTPTANNPDMKRSFRISDMEWQYIKAHIAEIDQCLQNLMNQNNG